MRHDVKISVPVHSTEMEERVLQAIINIFPDAIAEITESGIEAAAPGLEAFATKIHNQKIRDTARSVLFKSISGNGLSFHLNKQAAFAGKVNFSDGHSVLGDIEVRIRTAQPEKVIDSLTRTSEVEE